MILKQPFNMLTPATVFPPPPPNKKELFGRLSIYMYIHPEM